MPEGSLRDVGGGQLFDFDGGAAELESTLQRIEEFLRCMGTSAVLDAGPASWTSVHDSLDLVLWNPPPKTTGSIQGLLKFHLLLCHR